jgi:hypothetical protein
MSVQAIAWALGINAGSSIRKLILISIANYADDQGVAWPALQTVADHANCSRRTVIRKIEELQQAGFLVKEERHHSSGRQQSNAFRLLLLDARQRTTNREEGGSLTPREGDSLSPPRVTHLVTPEGDTALSPKPLEEPSEGEKRGNRRSWRRALTNEENVALIHWDGMAKHLDLAQVRYMSKQRHMKFRHALQDIGIEGWEAALEKIRASDFCQGRNDRGWKIDFDFVCTPGGFTKLIEGKYDNRTKVQQHGSSRARGFAQVDAVIAEARRRENGDGPTGGGEDPALLPRPQRP